MGGNRTDDWRLYFLLFKYCGVFPYLLQKKRLVVSKSAIVPTIILLAATVGASMYLFLVPKFDDEKPGSMNYFLSICLLVLFPCYVVFIQLTTLLQSSNLKRCFRRLLRVYSTYYYKRAFAKLHSILAVEILMTFQLAVFLNFSYILTRIFLLNVPLIDHINIVLSGLAVCRIVETAIVNMIVTFLTISKCAVQQMKIEIGKTKFLIVANRDEKNFRKLNKILGDYEEIYLVLRYVNHCFSFSLLLVTISCLFHIVKALYYSVIYFIKPEGTVYDIIRFAAFIPLSICYLIFDCYLCLVCNSTCREVSIKYVKRSLQLLR